MAKREALGVSDEAQRERDAYQKELAKGAADQLNQGLNEGRQLATMIGAVVALEANVFVRIWDSNNDWLLLPTIFLAGTILRQLVLLNDVVSESFGKVLPSEPGVFPKIGRKSTSLGDTLVMIRFERDKVYRQSKSTAEYVRAAVEKASNALRRSLVWGLGTTVLALFLTEDPARKGLAVAFAWLRICVVGF